MVDLFLYGTLRYVPLLELVLGRGGDALKVAAAYLPEHQVYQVQDQPFPAIAAAVGERAKGILVRGLSQDDLDALNYYEGGFDYALQPVEVQLETGGTAQVQRSTSRRRVRGNWRNLGACKAGSKIGVLCPCAPPKR